MQYDLDVLGMCQKSMLRERNEHPVFFIQIL